MKKIILVLLALALITFAYWTISPLFITKVADEPLPAAALPIDPNQSTTEVAEPELESEADAAANTSEVRTLPDTSAPRISPIQDTPGHAASGNVRIVTTPEEQIIRYEDYNGTNGPDLKIYLAKDLDATDFIDLGPARANQGNINYAVPMDIDIDDYAYVLTWCEAFGVLFDYAEIN